MHKGCLRISAIINAMSTEETDRTRCCQVAVRISGMFLGAQFKSIVLPHVFIRNETAEMRSSPPQHVMTVEPSGFTAILSNSLGLKEFFRDFLRLLLVPFDGSVQVAHDLIG